jgi:hypothetical protein
MTGKKGRFTLNPLQARHGNVFIEGFSFKYKNFPDSGQTFPVYRTLSDSNSEPEVLLYLTHRRDTKCRAGFKRSFAVGQHVFPAERFS